MFLVQPLVGKIVTPQYGGVSQVWTLCLLFFQLALLGGYLLTYLLSRWPARVQGIVYICAMVVSLFVLRIPPGEFWTPESPDTPIVSLLGQLMLYLAVPFVLLSTVSTMMQNWFRLSRLGDPYHLYGLSNIGSMSALVAYPLLIEPNMTVGMSTELWIWGYRLLVLAAVVTAVLVIRKTDCDGSGEGQSTIILKPGPDYGAGDFQTVGWWVFLSTAGTVLLISFTNHLTHNIAPIPLLWVIPLALYLLSFVLSFGYPRSYHRSLFVFGSHALLILPMILSAALPVKMLLNFAVLFFLCMVCHGEVYRKRPEASKLPVFYLTVAFGGALGGILVNLVAPVVLNTFVENRLILLVMVLYTLYLIARHQLRLFFNPRMDKAYVVGIVCMLAWAVYVPLYRQGPMQVVFEDRNFYSAAAVMLSEDRDMLWLHNGTIAHGSQMIDKKSGRFLMKPTTYYSEDSAVGLADRFVRMNNGHQPVKIGVIGLGAGTIAAYGEPGDEITFFEIDPKIERIARKYFRFLEDSRAKIEVILGDGRTSLKNLPMQGYDILVVDAFNGDAIPVHLLTKEAMALYASHVKPDGLILIHSSNEYLDLHPVTSNLGKVLSLNNVSVETIPHNPRAQLSSYSVLSGDSAFFEWLGSSGFRQDFRNVRVRSTAWYPEVGVWTDDYSNLFSVFRFVRPAPRQNEGEPQKI